MPRVKKTKINSNNQSLLPSIVEQLKPRNNILIIFIFLLITATFWYLRLNNFTNTMNFILDQPGHMRDAKEMVVSKKLPLIGPMEGTRKIYGKSYFIGPHYYYILGILGIVFNWDVIAITKFVLFYWWITALILFFWIAKKLDWLSALFAYILIAAIPYLVSFNKMIVNPNFLSLIGTALLYFLWKAYRENLKRYWLLTGILAGVAFSFHFSGTLWFLIIFVIWALNYIKKVTRLPHLILFGLGVLIGDLPYFIFELRHDFYNLRTIIDNGVNPHGLTFLTPFYYYSFLPVFLWAAALIYFYIGKKISYQNRVLILLVTFLLIFKSNFPLPNRAFGMPPGWTVTKQKYVANIICQDQDKKNFEVANIVSADFRAEELRWWTQECGSKSLPYDGYPTADTLFMIDHGQTVNNTAIKAWEVATMNPRKIEYSIDLGDGLWFYKITRVKL